MGRGKEGRKRQARPRVIGRGREVEYWQGEREGGREEAECLHRRSASSAAELGGMENRCQWQPL